MVFDLGILYHHIENENINKIILIFIFLRTENTPMIVGLGKAAELVIKNLDKYSSHMREIRDYLEKRLEVFIIYYIK